VAGRRSEAIPIRIEWLRFTQNGGKGGRAWVVLAFRNESGVTASEVRFLVRYDGSETVIVDKGTFSPGTLIVHQFIAPRGRPSAQSSPDATVQSVVYVDGGRIQR